MIPCAMYLTDIYTIGANLAGIPGNFSSDSNSQVRHAARDPVSGSFVSGIETGWQLAAAVESIAHN